MNKILYETSYIGNVYEVLYIILFFCISLFLCFRLKKAVITVFIIGLMAIYTIHLINSYIDVVVAYKNGNYVEIEGRVEDYYEEPYKGYDEYFTVDGVRFECSYGSPTWGYQKQRKNEIIISGRHLKIRYIPLKHENVIVYIEQMMPEEREPD